MATVAVKYARSKWIDAHAFECAFALGFVLIVSTKLIGRAHPIVGGIVASFFGIFIMQAYIALQKRSRPAQTYPRLGDEVYYLGLLYTLTSLCAALVILFLLESVGQTIEQRTDEMIGSFGIALLTTMAGIVMRMPLQRQGAEGLATVIRIPYTDEPGAQRASGSGHSGSEEVMIDLERYAYELRRQLQNSANAFASHTNQAILQAKAAHAHMEEMINTFHHGLDAKAKAELESLEAIYKAVAAQANQATQQTLAQQSGIQVTLEKLQSQIIGLDTSVERLRIGSGETAGHLENIGVQTKVSADAIEVGRKAVTDGLTALVEAAAKEETYQQLRTQAAKQFGDTLDRQAEEWATVQQRSGQTLEELHRTQESLANLGREAQRLYKEFASLPDMFRSAQEAVRPLVEMTEALGALPDINIQAHELANQLSAITSAGKQQEKVLDSTASKLQALAGIAGSGIDGLFGLNKAITEIGEVTATAAKYTSGIKQAEREIQRVNAGLKHVENTMRVEGLQLAGVLKDAILAFDEAKDSTDNTKSFINKIFRA